MEAGGPQEQRRSRARERPRIDVAAHDDARRSNPAQRASLEKIEHEARCGEPETPRCARNMKRASTESDQAEKPSDRKRNGEVGHERGREHRRRGAPRRTPIESAQRASLEKTKHEARCGEPETLRCAGNTKRASTERAIRPRSPVTARATAKSGTREAANIAVAAHDDARRSNTAQRASLEKIEHEARCGEPETPRYARNMKRASIESDQAKKPSDR